MQLNRILYAGVCLLLGGSIAFGGPPPLTEKEVIRIANAFAIKEGVCLACYKRPVVRYHKARDGNYWSAYYVPMRVDGHIAVDTDFSVRVDEASRTASEIPLR
jgi:hypothetical protein